MIRAIVFDFDGVIAESVSVKTEAFAEIYRPYGKGVVNDVVTHHLANGGVSRFDKFRIYHRDFLGVELKEKQLLKLTTRFSDLVLEKVIKAPYVPGAIEFIRDNYKKYGFFISSGTPENEMKEIVRKREIENYFVEVHGAPESKSEHVRKILKKHNYSNSEIVFIGDAMTDLEAASKNRTHFIARIDPSNTSLRSAEYQMETLLDLRDQLMKIEGQS